MYRGMHSHTWFSPGFASLACAFVVLAELSSACAGRTGASGARSDHDVRTERAAGVSESSSDRGHNSQLESHARSSGHHAHTK